MLVSTVIFFGKGWIFGANANSAAPRAAAQFAANTAFWGTDLTKIPGFSAAAQIYFDAIRDRGVLAAMQDAIHASGEESQ